MVDFVELNGAKLAYRIHGPEDAPLMITLHGGRGLGTRLPLSELDKPKNRD